LYSTRKILSLKKIIFYFSGFSLSIIFALVLCEFFSRIFFGGVFRNDPVLTRNSENALNYNGNQYTKFTSFEWDVDININSRGFRDEEKIYESNNDKILILGDSFTEGFGVKLEDSFTKKFQNILEKNSYSFDVYNAGISGNNLVDYIEIYENYFSMDDKIKVVVIALYVGNDLIDSYKIRKIENIKKKNITFILKNFAAKNLTFYNVLNRFIKSNPEINKFFVSLGLIHEKRILNKYQINNELLKKKVNFSMKLIKNFDEKIKDKKFFLLIIPSKEQIDFVYWNFLVDVQKEKISNLDKKNSINLIEKLAIKYQINYLNLLNTFEINQRKAELYFKFDPHTNILGHELIASELFKKMKDSKFFK
jgi:lysophospholipase L1-like esterase|tara:strand:+ start:5412 stop:6506 length:1095 start_codon:yes stop_codon:yes gene_type:complete